MRNPNNSQLAVKTAIAESWKMTSGQPPLVRLKADIALSVGLARIELGITVADGKVKSAFQAEADGRLADQMRERRAVLSDGYQRGKKARVPTHSAGRGQRGRRFC